MAEQEAAYTVRVCAHPVHTLLAIEREFNEEGVVENLRVVRPNAADHHQITLWAPDADS